VPVVPDRRHLVMVVPGIGGSVLARPADGKVVWDAGFGDIADLLARPGRLSLAENPHLTPVGLIRSKRLVPGWTVIDGYDRLWDRLAGLHGMVPDEGIPGRRLPGANLVAFGYDFRRSIVEAAEGLADEVGKRLAGLGWDGDDADKRVIVVAHSMGGLVARYWLGPLDGWRTCRALVTLGTPHRGAPKALDVLVNGVRLLGTELSRPSNLLREWASPYELLPRYPCVWDAVDGQRRYPFEVEQLGLGQRAREAFALHEHIARGCEAIPRSGPELVVRLGYSHPTLASATWNGKRLAVSKDRPSWLRLGRWDGELGDGTVPAISALPLEMEGCDPTDLRVVHRHGRIAALEELAALLDRYEGWPAQTPARGEERPVALGVDVDELNAAGVPIRVSVRLHGVEDADAAGVPVKVTLRAAGAAPRRAEARLEWDPSSAAFLGDLPGQPPGMYDVEVAARAVPGGGDLDGQDSIAVVAGDDLH